MSFEDLHEFPGNNDYYAVPNENLDLLDTLLQDVRVHRAAGICSGGEVGFFSLLPRAQRELVLVDHSYKSLYFAYVKYVALQKLGPEATYKCITEAVSSNAYTRTNGVLQALAYEAEVDVPDVLKRVWRSPENSGSGVFEQKAFALAEFWRRQSKERVIKSCAKINKVTFLHGDLCDLASKGKFGLLYLSNALEGNHYTRDRKRSVPAQVVTCLIPNGYVLTTESSRSYDSQVYPSNWEVVNEVVMTEPRRGGELNWSYKLHRVRPVAA